MFNSKRTFGGVMLKRSVFVAGILLGFMGSQAIASDETVYIDGQPCGTFCQAYMAWARGYGQPARQADVPAQRPADSAVAHAKKATPKLRTPAASNRAAVPKTRLSKKVNSPPVHSNQPAIDRPEDSTTGSIEDQSKASDAAKPDSSPGAGAAVSDPASVQQSAAEAKDAEKPSEGVATTEGQPAGSSGPEIAASRDEPVASTPAGNNLVAIIFARPEIGSISELSGKQIAIVESESKSTESIRSAISAAGASDVQLSDSAPINAMDSVINGQIPAAVIALLSSEAADRFHEISGFNIFRVPVSLQ